MLLVPLVLNSSAIAHQLGKVGKNAQKIYKRFQQIKINIQNTRIASDNIEL